MRMAAEGDELLIAATLPELKGSIPVEIGKIDGNDLDVKGEGSGFGMTPYWNYMGHKYNREWVRSLLAPQDMSVKMILLEEAEEGVLTAEPKPLVEGKTLSWDLNAGEKITFRDGLAKISWRRLNSYIGVDQIVISPME